MLKKRLLRGEGALQKRTKKRGVKRNSEIKKWKIDDLTYFGGGGASKTKLRQVILTQIPPTPVSRVSVFVGVLFFPIYMYT